MKRINPEEITANLSEEQLEILAEMMGEKPTSKEWLECHKKLDGAQLFLIHQKRIDLIQRKEQERLDAMTNEERQAEDEKWKIWYENLSPNHFHGNMGEPETLNDYKNRYGVYPSGYDKNGNKI
ncbi:hypothetical protein ACFFLS_08520 [Flavobacterium procerum]|uniref:Uncharacterized protein n=1 Tax=Flavobacterium procerum TaxID=1455569 RepID=A0ABV6BSQ8_9FLAO